MTPAYIILDRLDKIFLAVGFGVILAGCFEQVALGVRCIRGRECVHLRDRFPGFSTPYWWFGPRVRAYRLGIRQRRLLSKHG